MSPARRTDGGLRLDCRERPGAARDRVLGIVAEGPLAGHLAVTVTAPTECGKANGAVIKLLAPHFRLSASSFRLVHGATRREKTLAIDGVTGEEWAGIELALAALRTGKGTR